MPLSKSPITRGPTEGPHGDAPSLVGLPGQQEPEAALVGRVDLLLLHAHQPLQGQAPVLRHRHVQVLGGRAQVTARPDPGEPQEMQQGLGTWQSWAHAPAQDRPACFQSPPGTAPTAGTPSRPASSLARGRGPRRGCETEQPLCRVPERPRGRPRAGPPDFRGPHGCLAGQSQGAAGAGQSLPPAPSPAGAHLVGAVQRADEQGDLLHHRQVLLQVLQLLEEARGAQVHLVWAERRPGSDSEPRAATLERWPWGHRRARHGSALTAPAQGGSQARKPHTRERPRVSLEPRIPGDRGSCAQSEGLPWAGSEWARPRWREAGQSHRG